MSIMVDGAGAIPLKRCFYSRCRKAFTPGRRNGARQIFCRHVCAASHHRQGPLLTKNCLHCKKEFTTYNKCFKFCGKQCRIDRRNANNVAKSQAVAPTLQCRNCGKDYKRWVVRKFCSYGCREEWDNKQKALRVKTITETCRLSDSARTSASRLRTSATVSWSRFASALLEQSRSLPRPQ